MKALSGVMVAVAEGLFDVGGVDCGEASDSSRFTAQPHRHPPSSITNRINLAVIIGAQPMFRHARSTRRQYHFHALPREHLPLCAGDGRNWPAIDRYRGRSWERRMTDSKSRIFRQSQNKKDISEVQ
jgi:hypothetical protein